MPTSQLSSKSEVVKDKHPLEGTSIPVDRHPGDKLSPENVSGMGFQPKYCAVLPENENKVGYVHVPESTKVVEKQDKYLGIWDGMKECLGLETPDTPTEQTEAKKFPAPEFTIVAKCSRISTDRLQCLYFIDENCTTATACYFKTKEFLGVLVAPDAEITISSPMPEHEGEFEDVTPDITEEEYYAKLREDGMKEFEENQRVNSIPDPIKLIEEVPNNFNLYNTGIETKKRNFEAFAELMKNQFWHGGDKYKLSENKEFTDGICECFPGESGVDFILATCMKYLGRYKNFGREKDILKVATYMFIMWLKGGFHLSDTHDEDTNKDGASTTATYAGGTRLGRGFEEDNAEGC